MQVGDLVESIFLHGDTRGYYPSGHMGIIVAEVSGKTSTADNDKFRVVWTCGGVSESMWDYDLKKVGA